MGRTRLNIIGNLDVYKSYGVTQKAVGNKLWGGGVSERVLLKLYGHEKDMKGETGKKTALDQCNRCVC